MSLREDQDYHFRYTNPERHIAQLRRTLELHHISQGELARAAGVCPTQVSRWLHGRVTPQLQSLIRLDEALSHLLYVQAE
jgi:transcriptional regulator with XRE-family HTH domain